jgi:hypothetical protein
MVYKGMKNFELSQEIFQSFFENFWR